MGRHATTAIEFALVAIPFLLVIFGTLEFARFSWTNEALQKTVIAGARCMGLLQSGCGTGGVYSPSMTTSYVQTMATAWAITVPTSGISLNNAASCAGVSGFSQVTVSYTFKTVVPVFLTSIAAGIPISATACFPNNAG
jgi:Flp pilus assembly protein TadG